MESENKVTFDTYEYTASPYYSKNYDIVNLLNPESFKTENKISSSSSSDSSKWWENYSTSNNSTNNGLFQNGDTVEIKSKKSKYGHTATYYNGKWYSDFALTNMNPYNDPNALIRIFRNPNALEAEEQGRRVASLAGTKSTRLCAKFVRTGLGYKAEGYNGGNFGDFLLKKGWTRIARNGIKFLQWGDTIEGKWDTYESTAKPTYTKDYNYVNEYVSPLTFTTYDKRDTSSSSSSSSNWWDNYSTTDNSSDLTYPLKVSNNLYVNYLKQKGFSDIAARGIVGNIMLESGGNTNAISKDGHNSVGLVLWTGSRKAALLKAYGNNPTWQLLLDFMIQELNTTHKKALAGLQNALTIEDATKAFMLHYEKPNIRYANLNKRIEYAKSI